MGVKTGKMMEVLQNVKPNQLDDFMEKHWNDLLHEDNEFTKYMRELVKNKGLKWSDVYRAAGMSEGYGHDVIAMRKHVKNRDVIIRICLAAKFNFHETQQALNLYGLNPLYGRDPRDVVLIVAIHNRIFELADVDDMLSEQGFEIISPKIE